MIILGYKGRTSFMSSLTVAQISEFSLILVFLGQKVGHLSDSVVPIITFVAIITISISTYMILYSNKLYQKLSNRFSILRSKKLQEDSLHMKKEKRYPVICIGYEDAGKKILSGLKKKGTLIIDFDPEAISAAKTDGFDSIYGDVADPNVVEDIIIAKPKIIISTILDVETNVEMTKTIKNKIKTQIVALARNKKDARKMYHARMDYVIVPSIIVSEKTDALVKDILSRNKIELNWFEKELKEEIE